MFPLNIGINAEMASLPLSKVREVKEKLGIKLFNDAFFGREEKKEDETIEGTHMKKVFKVWIL